MLAPANWRLVFSFLLFIFARCVVFWVCPALHTAVHSILFLLLGAAVTTWVFTWRLPHIWASNVYQSNLLCGAVYTWSLQLSDPEKTRCKRFRDAFKSDRLNHFWRWKLDKCKCIWLLKPHMLIFPLPKYKWINMWERFIGYMACYSQIWQQQASQRICSCITSASKYANETK